MPTLKEMGDSCREMKRLAKAAIDANKFANAAYYMGEAQTWLRRMQDYTEEERAAQEA